MRNVVLFSSVHAIAGFGIATTYMVTHSYPLAVQAAAVTIGVAATLGCVVLMVLRG